MNKDIERRLAKLDALESGGVSDWKWYEESLKNWSADIEREKAAEEFVEYINELAAEAKVDEPARKG